jgi:Raf kinase inhibitor-like YbhB/YbcL family protein
MPTSTAPRLALLLAVALLAGCSSTPPSSPTDSPSPAPTSSPLPPSQAPSPSPTPGVSMTSVGVFVLTSTDFVDGGTLEPAHYANAWGQCSGNNLNPQLSWENAPAGTASFAVTMKDISAGDWVHWVHVNIPADVTSVATGASGSLSGIPGSNAASSSGYFGPCPPSPNHRYEFTVWALDAVLDLSGEPTLSDFAAAGEGHVLAQASIVGVASPV